MATYMPIPGDAPEAVQALATQLRDAKEAAGLSVQKLAKKAHFSTATISVAASGKKVPTWPVTKAFVEACEDTKGEAYWRALWTDADAAEKSKGDEETETDEPSPASTTRPRTSRRSVDELIDEALQRNSKEGANPELNRLRTQLELCISAERFCALLRGARGHRSVGEIKDRALAEGYAIRKFDILSMTKEDSNTVPENGMLHAFLVGCQMNDSLLQLWFNTATRLQLMETSRAQPRGPMSPRRRFSQSVGRAFGGMRFEALVTLICTMILTLAQVYQLSR